MVATTVSLSGRQLITFSQEEDNIFQMRYWSSLPHPHHKVRMLLTIEQMKMHEITSIFKYYMISIRL